ncbi:MAG TPA: serine/threonine-protein kinase, partial [Pyrinomonadaceae bacterium]|nr:serine/threonine-protein kinase [Pyrinomonadaceae bacterium]
MSQRDRSPAGKASPNTARSSISYDSIDDARFIPGTVLAHRYRIVGLLGRGGMGEVYRADDLKLGQPVALKFLPGYLSIDGAALARFHREVRVARQVSHRNVCRVYDIGEVDGHHFLSMEYIKGEELSSLLRRIGRLPADKAVEIARQLCAGLAAAHDNGVLHRDLKPANVMIDENGNVRVTDFGLAGLAEEFHADELRAGTPAYMSPEQLSGGELTVKSDIYSLGLVLYEVFTGKRAFEVGSLAELVQQRRSDTMPTSPSSLVKDIDPVVERVILRCLEKDPNKRPASALQVAAALPGGDPLAAALAAGETPSPEMVAAAPKEGVLRPAVALSLFASVIIGLALIALFAEKLVLYGYVPLEKPPDVLRERARDMIRKFGYAGQAVDDVYGFEYDRASLEYIERHDPSPARWQKLKSGQPAAVSYWYRQNTAYLEPLSKSTVEWHDPPPIMSGMTGVRLDMRGRLLHFYRVPSQVEGSEAQEASQPADWSILFNEAGLEMMSFKPAESKWAPLYTNDERAAWEGVYPENPQIPIRIEAASYRGKPVYFEIVNPWDRPAREEPFQLSANLKALFYLLASIYLLAL